MNHKLGNPVRMVQVITIILVLAIPGLSQSTLNAFIGFAPLGQTVFTSSAEAIRSAQMALRDRGYYNGPISGILNFQTRNAIRQFQRDRNLSQTGELDLNTARALGIASSTGEQSVPVEVENARAERIDRDTIRITADARTPSGGWQVFTDQHITGDTLHVNVRGVPPRGPASQGLDHHTVTAQINNASRVTRAIFHGAQRDITVPVSGPGGGSPVVNSRQILLLANQLFDRYQRILDIRGGRDNIIFDNRRRLREVETEMLFHLYSLRAGADLFNQMATRLNDTDALTGAAEALVRQARLINRLIARNQDRLNLPPAFRSDWERLRVELSRINPSYGDFDADIIR